MMSDLLRFPFFARDFSFFLARVWFIYLLVFVLLFYSFFSKGILQFS